MQENGPDSVIEKMCEDKGLKMTEQRRIVARVLSAAEDHPDVEEVYKRCSEIDEKISIAKKNGCDFIINYSKDDFAKKVLEFTKGKGVPVVYDGVGKNTFHKSIECLKTRGMMVSFGNASGPLSDINVPKMIQPKGLYLVRPSMQQYLSTRKDLDEASKLMFEKISSGKIKIKIFKKYKLDQIIQAHKDLENRKILGPAVIIP